MNKSLSDKIYILKAFCVIAIVCAHSPFRMLDNRILVEILDKFSNAGVPIFLALSAYFFQRSKKNFSEFWRNKLKTLFIPWVVAGTLMYLKNLLNGSEFSLLSYFYYMIGNRSLLYFLTILTLCYLAMWNFRDLDNKVYYFLIILNIVVKELYILNVLPDTSNGMLIYKNQYLNLFNYLGFFSIGLLVSKKDCLGNLICKHKDIKNLLLSLIVIVICGCVDRYINYATVVTWILTIVSWFVVFSYLSVKLVNIKVLADLGRTTMPIYLYHLFIVSKVLTSDYGLNSGICAILRPLLVVVTLYVIFKTVDIVTKKINRKLNGLYHLLIGIR